MQLSSQSNEFIEFKDEIMKKIHILENKFLSEFNHKFSQINSNFQEMDIRINIISQNNNSLLDLVTKQNFNFDKINEFDIYKNKTDQNLITQKIQLKNILQEIKQIKDNYEKIVMENLIIPGSIGPGSTYKNLSEYLVYHMDEFNKLRNETEQNKKKTNDSEKTALSIISNALFRFQSYTDNKNRQMTVAFEKKYETFHTKILDLETKIENFKSKIDKFINSIQTEMQKILKSQKINNENIDKKFEEINQKINSLISDFESFKKIIFQSINNNDNERVSNTRGKFTSSKKNIFNLNNNLVRSNFKTQIQEKNKINNASNKDDDQKNSSGINNNNNNNFSEIISDVGSSKRKNSSSQLFNNNESKNNSKEINFPISSEKFNKEQMNRESNNLNAQPYIKIKNLENLKLTEKRNVNDKNENAKKFNSSNNFSKDDEMYKENDKNNNKKYIDKAINVGNFLQNSFGVISDIRNIPTNSMTTNKEQINKYNLSYTNNNITINKEQIKAKNLSNNNNMTINKKQINTYNLSNNDNMTINKEQINTYNSSEKYTNNNYTSNKIQINSINISKGEKKLNNLAEKEYDINSIRSENNYGSIKPKKLKKTSSIESKSIEKTDNREFSKNKELIIVQSKNNSSISEYQEKKSKKGINSELSNKEKKENINLKAFILPKSNLATAKENIISATKKLQTNLQMNTNIEQQKIMSKIREYYTNRRKLSEARSTKRIVDCNVINLNLNNSAKNNRHSSHSSPRNTFYSSLYSKMNKMTNFGQTNFKFFSKRERYSRSKILNSLENKNNY